MTREKIAWHVYIVECGDGTLYTGVTTDLRRRLKQHAAGTGAKYTRARGDVILRWSEPRRSHGAALRREAAIKRLRRADKLSLIARKEARGRRKRPASAGAHASFVPTAMSRSADAPYGPPSNVPKRSTTAKPVSRRSRSISSAE